MGNFCRESVLNAHKECVNSGFAKLMDFMNVPLQVKAKNAYVYDENETEYLDCGGYGVFLLGHSHPRIVEKVKQQLDISSLSNKLMVSPETSKAAKALIQIAPEGLEYVMFINSGAEAVESALKIARLNGRNVIISMKKGFHGKTLGALSATGRSEFQDPFTPLLPDVFHVTFGSIDELEEVLRKNKDKATVILEPIQAEGGVMVPPAGYLKEVRTLCDDYGAILIVDEIQTGLGRLGDWWGVNQEEVVPDILLSGKILSGGIIPVAATIVKESLFEPLNKDPLLHTSTYAGSPLAMVAVQETIQIIKDEHLLNKATVLGARLNYFFKNVINHFSDIIYDIRGKGLLWGLEFRNAGLAGRFMMELLNKKIIISNSLNSNRVVRITPPAILDNEQVNYLETTMIDSFNKLRLKSNRG